MANENWLRSYVVEFGTPYRELDNYHVTEETVVPDLQKRPNTFEVNGICTPSDAVRLSNLASDDNSLRGFTFSLDSVRSIASSNSNNEMTTVQLYNLDKETSEYLQKEGAVMRIYAGYGGEVTLAYSGDIISVTPKRQGQDKIWNIQCKDGANDEKNTRISIDYAEGTTDSDIIVDLVNRYPSTSLGTSDLSSLSDRVETGGRSFVGKLVTQLDKHLTKFGLNYGRFNGKFTIVPFALDEEFRSKLVRTNYDLTADIVKSIDPMNNNGMKTSSDEEKETVGVVVNTFYIPIELGQMFTIDKEVSEDYSGTYTVQRIKTSLQSNGQMWDVALTGIKI